MICSSFLSLSLGCENQHLLPSSRLLISIPIHAVILSLQPTLSSGSFSLKNKLAIQTPTCFSKYCTLTCKVPSSASPSFLSCPYSYHLGCYSSVLPFLGCYPQSSLEDAVFPFGLFQSKFVQVSYITLSLGSFSSPFAWYLTDLIQAVNCLCGCLVPSP